MITNNPYYIDEDASNVRFDVDGQDVAFIAPIGGTVNDIYLIGSNDGTTPTDQNGMSALRIMQEIANANPSGRYVTVEYFERLFAVHNGDASVTTNSMDSVITDIEFKFGSWTNFYLSALGQNGDGSGGSGGGGVNLTAVWESLSNNEDDYTDVLIDAGHLPKATSTQYGVVKIGSGLGFDEAGRLKVISAGTDGFLTIDDAKQTYVSIQFFKRLFQAHNGDADVDPNSTDTIDSIEAMFGFWTEQYITALGQNGSGGSSGGGASLVAVWDSLSSNDDDFADIQIDAAHLGNMTLSGLADVNVNGVTDGQTLVYNATSSKWIAGEAGETYTHPTYTATTIAAATMKVLSAITVDSLGHVSSVSAKTLTASDIPSLSYIPLSGSSAVTGSIAPSSNGGINLGGTSHKWRAVYATEFVGALNGTASYASNAYDVYAFQANTSKVYVTGTTATSNEFGSLYYDTGVYLSTTAGELVANTFYAETGVESEGYVVALGTSSSSDERMKDILCDHELDLDYIADAPCIDFLWKHNEVKSSGSIAQYWQRQIPTLIHERSDGMLTMEYGAISLMSAISIARKVRDIDERVKILESKV